MNAVLTIPNPFLIHAMQSKRKRKKRGGSGDVIQFFLKDFVESMWVEEENEKWSGALRGGVMEWGASLGTARMGKNDRAESRCRVSWVSGKWLEANPGQSAWQWAQVRLRSGALPVRRQWGISGGCPGAIVDFKLDAGGRRRGGAGGANGVSNG